eukprot:g37447.t1
MGLVEVVKEILREVKKLQDSAQPSHELESKVEPNLFKYFTSVDYVVTSHKLKHEGKTKEKDKGVEVQLADTLFDEMVKETLKQIENQAE